MLSKPNDMFISFDGEFIGNFFYNTIFYAVFNLRKKIQFNFPVFLQIFKWFNFLLRDQRKLKFCIINLEINDFFSSFSLQVWFKNRRAKCRQQLQHQTSSASASNLNSSKSSGSSSTTRNANSSNTTSSSNSKTTNSTTNTTSGSSGTKSSHIKHTPTMASSGNGNNNNNSSANNNHNSTNNNNNTSNAVNNGLSALSTSNHHNNSSPILPITPSTSVSPPINVICKKELPYHHHNGTSGHGNQSIGNGNMDLKPGSGASSGYDSLKDSDLGITSVHHSSYLNINSRLGQTGGNLTPLGSNSSIMTTPSPPITPQASGHNPLSYVPNHESYNFWHNQYNQYNPNNYNTPSYYSQMDYFNNQTQSGYNMSHSGYSTSNFGLASSASMGGPMGAQTFSPDYMSQQDKYVNMV